MCGNEGAEVIKFSVNAQGRVTNINIVNGVCPEIHAGSFVLVIEMDITDNQREIAESAIGDLPKIDRLGYIYLSK